MVRSPVQIEADKLYHKLRPDCLCVQRYQLEQDEKGAREEEQLQKAQEAEKKMYREFLQKLCKKAEEEAREQEERERARQQEEKEAREQEEREQYLAMYDEDYEYEYNERQEVQEACGQAELEPTREEQEKQAREPEGRERAREQQGTQAHGDEHGQAHGSKDSKLQITWKVDQKTDRTHGCKDPKADKLQRTWKLNQKPDRTMCGYISAVLNDSTLGQQIEIPSAQMFSDYSAYARLHGQVRVKTAGHLLRRLQRLEGISRARTKDVRFWKIDAKTMKDHLCSLGMYDANATLPAPA